MTVGDDLQKICAEARPLIEDRLDLDEQLRSLRDFATENHLSWATIRAILTAEAKDKRDGGDRIQKLGEKASLATDYIVLMINAAIVANNRESSPQSPIAGLTVAAPIPDDGSIPSYLRR